jgi:hypothetical protein
MTSILSEALKLAWCSAIGTPNVFLSREYFVASSRARCARPVAAEATCSKKIDI